MDLRYRAKNRVGAKVLTKTLFLIQNDKVVDTADIHRDMLSGHVAAARVGGKLTLTIVRGQITRQGKPVTDRFEVTFRAQETGEHLAISAPPWYELSSVSPGKYQVTVKCGGEERSLPCVVTDKQEVQILDLDISVPAGNAQGAESAPPQFDANDLERTDRWAEAALERLRKAAGNGVRLNAALDKFDEEVQSYRDKKVRWRLEVASISETDVYLGRTLEVIPGVGSRQCVRMVQEKVEGGRAGPTVVWPSLKVGSGISKDRAAQLNTGDRIIVTAEVDSIRIRDDRPQAIQVSGGVTVTLRNLHAE